MYFVLPLYNENNLLNKKIMCKEIIIIYKININDRINIIK